MKLEFVKMQSCGNDYIYVDCFSKVVSDPVGLARSLSIRRLSVGSDGLVLILPTDGADAFMRIFNADGSEAKMCGNAVRCVGKYLLDEGISSGDAMTVRTLSGIKKLKANVVDGYCKSVCADMGEVSFLLEKVSVRTDGDVVSAPFSIDGKTYDITYVSVGNPHAVVFVDDPLCVDVAAVGKIISGNNIFPEGCNVEFVSPIRKDLLSVRVYERGSGETYSCGTGAVAAVAAYVKRGRAPFSLPVTVRFFGGDLTVTVEEGYLAKLDGECKTVYRGVAYI